MPARQPFTSLCQQLAQGAHLGRVDLHLHTTCSDGSYTPEEIVDLARRSGLCAVAITDHDTLAALPRAQMAARGSGLEVIAGVEISTEYRERELHLLAYFGDSRHAPLTTALAEIRQGRVQRFHEMVERLRACGVSLQEEDAPSGTIPAAVPESIGRRHLAEWLVRQGCATSVRDAFQRYLGDQGRVAVPKKRLPVAQAIALVRGAGGVAAWAHPAYDCTQESLLELRNQGLAALEVEYPSTRPSRIKELRSWAKALGLAVTGGSDCHGPGRRAVGACSITAAELAILRSRAMHY